MINPVARIREHLEEPLHRASWAVVASTAMMSGVGALFWAVATRVYSETQVGRGNALIFGMMLVAAVFQMNMSNVTVRFLPQVRDRIGLRIGQAYAVAATFSFFAALIFAWVAPALSSEYEFMRDPWWLTPVFAVSTAVWAIFVVQDPVLMGLGRATWMLPENFSHSAAKLALLPVLYLVIPHQGIFLAWVAPLFVIVPVVNLLIRRIAVPTAKQAQSEAGGAVEAFGDIRGLIKFMGQDFIGASATQIAIYATPLLTLALLGPEANAMFSVPFAALTGLDLLFTAILTSLTAEGARSPERIHDLTGMVVRRLLRIQIPLAVIVFIGAPLLMLPFAPEYAHAGTEVARILAVASIFRALMLFYEAVARLQGNGPRLMFAQLLNMILLIGLCFALSGPWGINGIAAAWLIAAAVTALATLPWLVAFLRNPVVRVGDGSAAALAAEIDAEIIDAEAKSPLR